MPVYKIPTKSPFRAWCRFFPQMVGTNAPIDGSGISSVTRNAVGDYTFNFSSPMPDTNYGYMTGKVALGTSYTFGVNTFRISNLASDPVNAAIFFI